MRTFFFFLCTTVFSLNSGDIFSQNTKIDIESDKTLTINEVFELIRQQTDYTFIYHKKLFKDAPKVFVKKGRIKANKLLKQSLSFGDFNYVIKEDGLIFLENKEADVPIKNPEENSLPQQQITGKVIDDTGMPLPGASVMIKGTTTGVVTSFEGDYSIMTQQDATTLVFSYLGYVEQEVLIAGRTNIDVTMVADNTSLEEIVIVGYGTQRKKDVAGAISTVKSEDLVLSSAASIGHVLQGKAAGLQVVQNSAQPGGGLDFLIRGAGSINASNQPLIVIDGFPITEFQQPDSGNRYDGGTQSILNSFNPNDIETVSVLKDASATSIYGARAANGVILITTKKGKTGKVQVDYSTSYSYQDYNDSFDVLELSEWMQLRNDATRETWMYLNRVAPIGDRTLEEAIADPVSGVPFKRFYSDDQIRNAGQGTDWLKLITRDGTIQQHNISLRGGTESTKYYLSGNLYEHKGVVEKSGFERASLRLNLDQKLNKFMNFGMNMSISRINNENSQLGGDQYEKSGIIRSAIQYGPHIQAIDEFGNYPINPDNALEPNPYSLLTITDEGLIDRTLTNFFLEIKPFTGLTARFQIGLDQGNTNRSTYLPRTTLHGALEGGKASIATAKKNDNLFDFTLNYSKILQDDHSFNVLLGYSKQKYKSEGNTTGNNAFITDSFLWNNMNAGAGTKVVSSSKGEDNLVSFFGRLNYVYKDRYILTSTVRRDGSSVFAKNNRFAIFPSFAVGWNVAEETFMENLSDQVSQLKIRFGYGETGNADIGGNAFASYFAQPAYLNPDESLLIGVFASRLENPDLKWETTRETNLGIDFEFFNRRLSGSVELYNKEISDLLQVKPINSYHEVNTVWANIGTTQSKGVEVTLNTVNIDTDNFQWKSTFTFSKFKDRWKERAPDWKPAVYQNVDDPIRAQYSYLSDGIMQIGDVVPAQPDLFPGQIKIKDVNGFSRDAFGDPEVDENGVFLRTGEPDGIIDSADTVLLGSSDPDFIGGFSNMLSYKNFSLNFHFNGMFGRQIVNQTDLAMGVSADGVAENGRNALRSVYNRWTIDNPSTTRPASHYGYSPYSSGDFWMQDAWFIRLQNLSFSYNLPSKLIGNFISDASIRLDAQNLFVITPYDGVDPETDAYVAAYPNVKTFTLGIDLKF